MGQMGALFFVPRANTPCGNVGDLPGTVVLLSSVIHDHNNNRNNCGAIQRPGVLGLT